jgi:hypothetical protein
MAFKKWMTGRVADGSLLEICPMVSYGISNVQASGLLKKSHLHN